MPSTGLISDQLARDLRDTLVRLRAARITRDTKEIDVCGLRLDWLMERVCIHPHRTLAALDPALDYRLTIRSAHGRHVKHIHR